MATKENTANKLESSQIDLLKADGKVNTDAMNALVGEDTKFPTVGAAVEIANAKAQEVLENVFEKLYEEENKEFAKLVNTYTGYRGDEPLKEIVLNIYRFMQSSPFPNEWLEEKVNMFSQKEGEEDFSSSVWGKVLLNNLKEEYNYLIPDNYQENRENKLDMRTSPTAIGYSLTAVVSAYEL